MFASALRAASLAALAACGGDGGGGGGLPSIVDVTLYVDDAFGASLDTSFGPVAVRPVEPTASAFGAIEGTDDVLLVDFPIGERLLRRGPIGPTAPLAPSLEVAFDVEAICAPVACVEDGPALQPVVRGARVLRDGGVAVMMDVSERDAWSALFLAKFDAEGRLQWTHELPDPYPAIDPPMVLAERADGGIFAAWRYEPDPEARAYADRGTAVRSVSADGEMERTIFLRSGSVVDAGHGIPADFAPWISAAIPLADGDVLLGGAVAYSRHIECGSYDDPIPPSSVMCSDYASVGFVARLSADGEVRWQRELGDGFVGERSGIGAMVEHPDGTLSVVGSITAAPGHSADPYYGGFVAHLTANGRVTSRLRLGLGALGTEGGAELTLPLADADGSISALYLRGYRDAWLLRLAPDGALTTVRPLPSGNEQQPYVTKAEVVGSSWVLLESWTREARQGWRHALGE